MFDKIKSAIFKATRNTLSRKDPEIVKWNNEMAKYEKNSLMSIYQILMNIQEIIHI